MTTIKDIKQAAAYAKRVPYQINQTFMTDPNQIHGWQRDLALLQDRIHAYAVEHGVEVWPAQR